MGSEGKPDCDNTFRKNLWNGLLSIKEILPINEVLGHPLQVWVIWFMSFVVYKFESTLQE